LDADGGCSIRRTSPAGGFIGENNRKVIFAAILRAEGCCSSFLQAHRTIHRLAVGFDLDLVTSAFAASILERLLSVPISGTTMPPPMVKMKLPYATVPMTARDASSASQDGIQSGWSFTV
jgi:hypothetical protein